MKKHKQIYNMMTGNTIVIVRDLNGGSSFCTSFFTISFIRLCIIEKYEYIKVAKKKRYNGKNIIEIIVLLLKYFLYS